MPRLSCFSPALAVSLSPRYLRLLDARFGGMGGVDLDDPLAVARALFARELPDDLVLALEDIARLATALGREAILEAARGRIEDLEPWMRQSPEDVAARVVLASRKRGARFDVARAILKRARVRVDRYIAPEASYEIVLPKVDVSGEHLLAAGRALYGDALADAWTTSHGETLHAVFLYDGLGKRTVHRREGQIRKHTTRELACDRIRVDGARRRVGFMLARPSTLPEWVGSVGVACADDASALGTRPAFTLRPAHEIGPDWHAKRVLPKGVRSVEVVACELDNGTRFSVRGPRGLAELHAALGAKSGYLLRATLRFFLEEGGATDATIELPNKLTIAEPRHEPLVRAAIDALLLTSPGTLPDDLPSLAPFEHAAWRWCEVITALAFAESVKDGVFVRAPSSRRAADVAHRPWGSTIMLHGIPGEATKYALSDDLSVHAYDVPPEASTRWKLDQTRFAARLRERMDLEPVTLKHAPPEGLLPIGTLVAGGTRAPVFQLMRVVRESEAGDLREKLRVACKPAPPVVLVGDGRTLGQGVAEVTASAVDLFGTGELGPLVVTIAEALGVEDELLPWRFGTKAAPLVILTERGQAWFGKVRLLLTANQYAMLVGLARTPAEWVTASELGERISRNAEIPDQVTRRTRMGWSEKIEKSFVDAGVVMPEGLPEKIVEADAALGRYRLGVGVVVR